MEKNIKLPEYEIFFCDQFFVIDSYIYIYYEIFLSIYNFQQIYLMMPIFEKKNK